MTLFLLAASGILVYGAVYVVFCIKKGGIAAALAIFLCLGMDLFVLFLLVYYRTRT